MKVARSFLGHLQTGVYRMAHKPKQTAIAAGCLALGVGGQLVHSTLQYHSITVDPPMLGGLLSLGFGLAVLGDVVFPRRNPGVKKELFGLS
jgi:hypothetical protein